MLRIDPTAFVTGVLLIVAQVAIASPTVPVEDGTPAILQLPDTGLDGDARIVHALNRLGYGPRPGDVSRVRRIGLERWIERQLDPSSIDDPALAERLAPLMTVSMTTAERLAAFTPRQLALAVGRQIGSQLTAEERERFLPETVRFDGRRNGDEGDAMARRKAVRSGPGPRVVSDELAQAKLIRAIYGERHLEEVLTDFWFNHFNVYVGKGAVRWWATDYEQTAIRPHALGRFRDLLGATARHPAMLFYLDNWLSSSATSGVDLGTFRLYTIDGIREQGLPPGGMATLLLRERGMDTRELERLLARRDARQLTRRSRGEDIVRGEDLPRRDGLNENYARELLELHTLGVDGGYTQRDIVEVARAFTGWTLLPIAAGQAFVYVDELHDKGPKRVLGQRIESAGANEGERVLDLLARHPSTARFVCGKLARRFVSDDPPAALVERMAATFRKTDGDIRAVLRTLFASPEFWAPEAERAKVKTPFEFVVSAARATGAELAASPARSAGASMSGASTTEMTEMAEGMDEDAAPDDAGGHAPSHGGAQGLVRMLFGMGQPLYGCAPPTGYDDRAAAWVSAGALMQRMKVALGLAADRLRGVRTDVAANVAGRKLDDDALNALAWRLTGTYPTETALAAIRGQLSLEPEELEALGLPPRFGRTPRGPARLAAGWILSAPEFQRR